MADVETIHVRLLDEGVDVWRPVTAQHMRENVYLIVPQEYDRDIETWEFEPGQYVVCDDVEGRDGLIFAATRRA